MLTMIVLASLSTRSSTHLTGTVLRRITRVSLPSSSFSSSSSSSSSSSLSSKVDSAAGNDTYVVVDGPDRNDENYLQNVYRKMAEENNVLQDEHQLRALRSLDRLHRELRDLPSLRKPKETESESKKEATEQSSSGSSSLWNLFGGWNGSNDKDNNNGLSFFSNRPDTADIRGVYLHGGVGCGKTFCMNLFHDHLDTKDKQEVHFHRFMLRVHQQMHEAKYVEGIEGDPLPRVVTRTLEQGKIICFDEFQVTDIADASILQELFTSLLEQGAVVVATSNRPPDDLYLGGLQRDRFLPFIELLKDKLEVVSLWDSETDYRLVQGDNKAIGVYFVGKEQRKAFDGVFRSLTDGAPVISTNLTTQGRMVPVPQASLHKGVARFTFEDLCTKALGAADYLVIGQNFHTVFVERIPALERHQINWVRRFIVFVDSMYESNVKLVLQAATQPEGIFEVDLDDVNTDEAFAFDRTRSRLEEMRSESYLQRRWSGTSVSTSPTEVKLRMEPTLSEDHVMKER